MVQLILLVNIQLSIVNCQFSGNLTYNLIGICINAPVTDIVNEFVFRLCEVNFLKGGETALGDAF